MHIRRYATSDQAAVVRLSLRAWEPVFDSLAAEMDPDVYRHFFPDWRESQAQSVAEACNDAEKTVWVADEDGQVVGFTAVCFRSPTFGEIYMIAVDPDYQQRGMAAALTSHALDWMKQQGAVVAMVETGDDPGHAPARRTYEKSGFKLQKAARYFKYLGEA